MWGGCRWICVVVIGERTAFYVERQKHMVGNIILKIDRAANRVSNGVEKK